MAQGVLGSAAADNAQICETMNAAAHVQAHRNALEQLPVESENKIIPIDLPFECDCHFCRRDDWGRDIKNHGLEIGLYRHEDASFQQQNQHVWILHIELSAHEHPNVSPLSPGRFNIFNA